jgi:hypothetical protein
MARRFGLLASKVRPHGHKSIGLRSCAITVGCQQRGSTTRWRVTGSYAADGESTGQTARPFIGDGTGRRVPVPGVRVLTEDLGVPAGGSERGLPLVSLYDSLMSTARSCDDATGYCDIARIMETQAYTLGTRTRSTATFSSAPAASTTPSTRTGTSSGTTGPTTTTSPTRAKSSTPTSASNATPTGSPWGPSRGPFQIG